jgi:quercetin dioxygenase-like cupin family protein
VRVLSAIVLVMSLGISSAFAQQLPAPKITPLVKAPVSGQPDKEFITVSAEWQAGAGLRPHTHLGDEYGIVMEGAYTVKQGSGDWVTYNKGQSWHVPAGVVHESKVTVEGTKTINSFIVEKDKPLTHPVQ